MRRTRLFAFRFNINTYINDQILKALAEEGIGRIEGRVTDRSLGLSIRLSERLKRRVVHGVVMAIDNEWSSPPERNRISSDGAVSYYFTSSSISFNNLVYIYFSIQFHQM